MCIIFICMFFVELILERKKILLFVFFLEFYIFDKFYGWFYKI